MLDGCSDPLTCLQSQYSRGSVRTARASRQVSPAELYEPWALVRWRTIGEDTHIYLWLPHAPAHMHVITHTNTPSYYSIMQSFVGKRFWSDVSHRKTWMNRKHKRKHSTPVVLWRMQMEFIRRHHGTPSRIIKMQQTCQLLMLVSTGTAGALGCVWVGKPNKDTNFAIHQNMDEKADCFPKMNYNMLLPARTGTMTSNLPLF